MATNIYLVRHGEASASWGDEVDPGLSELGRRQAEDAAKTLIERVPGEIELMSSPLVRAMETAQPLARRLNREVSLQEEFREIPSPVSMAHRQEWLRKFMEQQWHQQGKPLLDWRATIFKQLTAITQPTAIFTHFLVINAVVGTIMKKPETLCCWPDNGSITHLRLSSESLELVALGKQMDTHVN